MLTNTECKNKKPTDKNQKLFDRDGLFLLVTPAGSKLWRFKYRFDGKEKLISFGAYPEVGLVEARDRCAAARKQIAHGINPSQARVEASDKRKLLALNTFEKVTAQWLTEERQQELADNTREKLQRRLELDVFPMIGDMAIAAIDATDIRKMILRIKTRGALDIARRVFNVVGRIMRYAVSHGLCDRDPTRDLDLDSLVSAGDVKHHAGITNHIDVGALMRAIEGFDGTLTVRCALKLAPLVFVRPGELRHAEWSEIDFDKAEWRIPASKMKMKEQHIVPLSAQAIAILREIQPATGHGQYVFPSERGQGRPMSENTINAALRRMGYTSEQQTGHGFRTTASTILHELQYPNQWIERQLAHGERNKVAAAYNFAEHLPERRKMMQEWSDYLCKLREGAEVIPLKTA